MAFFIRLELALSFRRRSGLFCPTLTPNVKLSKATFENEYKPIAGDGDTENGSLNLKKLVENGQWAKTESYTFNVSFTGTSLTPVPAAYQNLNPIELKNGENYKFENLPVGITYDIVEDENTEKLGSAYIGGSYKIGEAEEKTFTADAEKKASGSTTANGFAVTFTNKFDSITPTGLAISVAPFIAMFAAVGAAIALYVAAKRRVR